MRAARLHGNAAVRDGAWAWACSGGNGPPSPTARAGTGLRPSRLAPCRTFPPRGALLRLPRALAASPPPAEGGKAGRLLPREAAAPASPLPGAGGPGTLWWGETLGREIRVRAVSSGAAGPGSSARPRDSAPGLLCLLPSRPQGGLSRPSRPPGPGPLAGPPARRRPRKDGARLGSPQAARGAQRPTASPVIVTSRALAECRAGDCQASLICSFCSHGRASAQQLRKHARTVASGFRSDSYAQLLGKDVPVLLDRSPVPGSPGGVGGTWLFSPYWSSVTSLEDKSL